MSYTQKCMENGKNPAYENRYDFESKQFFWLKFDTKIIKPETKLCKKFQFVSFNQWLGNNPSKSVIAEPGLSSHISIIWSKIFFLFHKPYKKEINSFREIALFEIPIWLQKEAVYSQLHVFSLTLPCLRDRWCQAAAEESACPVSQQMINISYILYFYRAYSSSISKSWLAYLKPCDFMLVLA